MRIRDERLAWAQAKLLQYQRVALKYFNAGVRVEQKADRSPVTIADRTIEELLRHDLGRDFPDDDIVGEEFGASNPGSKSFWTLDPVDGTRAFSRGLLSWGMLIGRVEQGKPVLGACWYPMFKTFLGVGRGVAPFEQIDGRVIRIRRAAAPPSLSDSVIFHGGSKWWLGTRYAKGFERITHACYLERAYGDCFNYLWLFRGKADAVIDHGLKIWDLVPFAAVARHTGHVALNFAGKPTFTGPQSVMAHPTLAREVCRILTGKARVATAPKWRVS